MTPANRALLRLAIAIHERLQTTPTHLTSVELLTAAWQQTHSLLRRVHRAQQRGWTRAAMQLRGDLQASLRRLQGELASFSSTLAPHVSAPPTTPRDLHADLLALHEEFDEVAYDRHAQTLSVTTESIELEDIVLGPFEIRLDWSHLPEEAPDCYHVIALAANPAASDETITHPHVQDESLCEGEGRPSIRSALRDGRLLDFFLIVANLLRTYNPSSPYVSLSDWQGVECGDCGASVSGDERWNCDKCQTAVCNECYVHCSGCDSVYCSMCVTRCSGCDENYCHGCIDACERCGADRCANCLHHERCSDCHVEESNDKNNEPDEPEATPCVTPQAGVTL